MAPQDHKGKVRLVLGLIVTLFIVFLFLMEWGTRIPKRPANISSKGVFLEVGVVPFKLSTHGDWLECWKDDVANLDRCRYTDEKGAVYYEDFVLPYEGVSPVPAVELIIDPARTRSLHYGVTDKNYRFPLIFLQNGQILLPKSDFEWGRKIVDFYVMRKNTDTGEPRR
jgi:hypothetical protein